MITSQFFYYVSDNSLRREGPNHKMIGDYSEVVSDLEAAVLLSESNFLIYAYF